MLNVFRIHVSPLSRWAALVCLLLGVCLQEAAATSPPMTAPPLPNVRVTVTPEVALPGVTRTLTISGTWHSGCTPVSPRLAVDAEAPETRVAIVTLRSIDPVCLSIAGPSPFSHQVEFTPGRTGVTGVLVLEEVSGNVIAQGQVVTRQLAKTHSLLDLEGTWYPAAMPGSSLSLTHSYRGDDSLIGAWFLHANGVAKWYSIQLGSWHSPVVFVGRLLEFEAPPQNCNQGMPGCPRASSGWRDIGWVRLTVHNDSTLTAEAHASPPVPTSVPLPEEATRLFSVTLNRFKL